MNDSMIILFVSFLIQLLKKFYFLNLILILTYKKLESEYNFSFMPSLTKKELVQNTKSILLYCIEDIMKPKNNKVVLYMLIISLFFYFSKFSITFVISSLLMTFFLKKVFNLKISTLKG